MGTTALWPRRARLDPRTAGVDARRLARSAAVPTGRDHGLYRCPGAGRGLSVMLASALAAGESACAVTRAAVFDQRPGRMTELAPLLTDEVITAATQQAEQDVCPPGDARCYGFAFGVAEALATLTPDG